MTRPSATLRVGEVAVVQASGEAGALHAVSIGVRHDASGQITAVAEAADAIDVAGQHVLLSPATRLAAELKVGAWVAVSGLRDPNGAIRATRIDDARRARPSSPACRTASMAAVRSAPCGSGCRRRPRRSTSASWPPATMPAGSLRVQGYTADPLVPPDGASPPRRRGLSERRGQRGAAVLRPAGRRSPRVLAPRRRPTGRSCSNCKARPAPACSRSRGTRRAAAATTARRPTPWRRSRRCRRTRCCRTRRFRSRRRSPTPAVTAPVAAPVTAPVTTAPAPTTAVSTTTSAANKHQRRQHGRGPLGDRERNGLGSDGDRRHLGPVGLGVQHLRRHDDRAERRRRHRGDRRRLRKSNARLRNDNPLVGGSNPSADPAHRGHDARGGVNFPGGLLVAAEGFEPPTKGL